MAHTCTGNDSLPLSDLANAAAAHKHMPCMCCITCLAQYLHPLHVPCSALPPACQPLCACLMVCSYWMKDKALVGRLQAASCVQLVYECCL